MVNQLDLRELPARQRPARHRYINDFLLQFRREQLRRRSWRLEWLLQDQENLSPLEPEELEALPPVR